MFEIGAGRSAVGSWAPLCAGKVLRRAPGFRSMMMWSKGRRDSMQGHEALHHVGPQEVGEADPRLHNQHGVHHGQEKELIEA